MSFEADRTTKPYRLSCSRCTNACHVSCNCVKTRIGCTMLCTSSKLLSLRCLLHGSLQACNATLFSQETHRVDSQNQLQHEQPRYGTMQCIRTKTSQLNIIYCLRLFVCFTKSFDWEGKASNTSESAVTVGETGQETKLVKSPEAELPLLWDVRTVASGIGSSSHLFTRVHTTLGSPR